MKQFFYVLRTLWRNKGTTIIKVVSLGLAIMMCSLLLTRIAFLRSYDTGFRDYKNLYQIWIKWGSSEDADPQPRSVGDIQRLIAEAYPEEIECSTTLFNGTFVGTIYIGSDRHDINGWAADEDVFHTLGVNLLEGDASSLADPNNVFISKETADKLYHNESPIGKSFEDYNKNTYIIRGIYETISENSSVRPDMIFSINKATQYWNLGGNCWEGFLRLKKPISDEQLDAMIERAIRPSRPIRDNEYFGAIARPLHEYIKNNEDTKRMCTIMGTLAAALILIASLNYVLLSLSSLSRRAKVIGVQKCNGASALSVFGMFLWETAVILALSLAVAAAVVLLIPDYLEELVSTPISSLISGDRIWIIGGILFVILLIGGVLPGYIFSKIPVTQVFRTFRERKNSWKRVLLFIEYTGVAFTCGLLVTMAVQYNYILNRERAFNPEPIALADNWATTPESNNAISVALNSLPYVESESKSSWLFFDSHEMQWVSPRRFPFLLSFADSAFIDTYDIKLVKGKKQQADRDILVNRAFIKEMKLSPEDAIGERIPTEYYGDFNITGVIEDLDFSFGYGEEEPLIIGYGNNNYPYQFNIINVKLKAPYDANIAKLNEEINTIFPDAHIEFQLMTNLYKTSYSDIKKFRDSVTLASVILIFITFMGLTGFVGDEVQRRRKEIAVRKVLGAHSPQIMNILVADVMKVAVPAIILGTAVAWYVGKIWLEPFAITVENLWIYYILSAIIIAGAILLCAVTMTYRISNENPAPNLKCE